jgi:hypothetical protein
MRALLEEDAAWLPGAGRMLWAHMRTIDHTVGERARAINNSARNSLFPLTPSSPLRIHQALRMEAHGGTRFLLRQPSERPVASPLLHAIDPCNYVHAAAAARQNNSIYNDLTEH